MERGFNELGDRLPGWYERRQAGDRGRLLHRRSMGDPGLPGGRPLVQAWAEAGGASTVRAIRRRERIGAIGRSSSVRASPAASCRPGSTWRPRARPPALLDGLVLQRIEDGDSWRARRRNGEYAVPLPRLRASPSARAAEPGGRATSPPRADRPRPAARPLAHHAQTGRDRRRASWPTTLGRLSPTAGPRSGMSSRGARRGSSSGSS
jgi:hypothetical protein